MPINQIQNNDRKERLIANLGQTLFAFDFPIYEATHLQVIRQRGGVETVLTYGTDYSVTGAGNQNGGTVILSQPSLQDDIIAILSNQPRQRNAQFVNGGDLPAAALEAEFNRIHILFQQQARDAAQGLAYPQTDPAMPAMPPAASRAAKFLAFDGEGKPFAANLAVGQAPATALGASLVAAASPASARTLLDAAQNTWSAPGAPTILRTVANALADRIDARHFGVKADAATDDTAAMQAAVNYVQNNGGGILHLPPGFIFVSSPITINKSLIMAGTGMGVGSGIGNSGGTVIRNTAAAGDVFVISSDESVILRDFSIDAAGISKNAGTAGIRISGQAGIGSINRRSRLENLRIMRMYDAIVMDSASDFAVSKCFIQDYLNLGVYSKQLGGTDSGHNVIDSCVIWDLNIGTSQAGVRYDKGGDIRLVNSKILGGTYGVRITIDDGETGTFLFTGNSFEQNIICLRVEQAVAGKNFGNLVVVGNQFSQVPGPGLVGSPQSNISIQAGTPGGGASHWIKNIAIVGNVINNAHNQSTPMISIQDGEGVTVVGNQGTANGNAAPTGIDIGNAVASAKVTGNVFQDTPGGAYINQTSKFQTPVAVFDFSTGATAVPANTTTFVGKANESVTEANCLFYLPMRCRVLNMHCNASSAPSAGQSFTYTLRVNEVDTALVASVSGANSDCQNRANIVSVPSPAGPNTAARVSLKLVTSASAVAARHQISFTVVEDES
jgi:hypothetical protein